MRKAIRFQDNNDYWDQRWVSAGADSKSFGDISIYPIRFAEMVKPESKGSIAELGCGLGRIAMHYHNQSYTIVGLERSKAALDHMRQEKESLMIIEGDVIHLPFRNEVFDTVLAFGLYHNLEIGMQDALAETVRCLKRGGRFSISVRPDNFEMNINEIYWRFKERNKNKGKKYFHKWLFKEHEFKSILERLNLRVEHIYHARNVSVFWRVPFLRASNLWQEKESNLRSYGYRLNALGRFIDTFCTRLFPASFFNVLVYLGRRID